MTAKIHSYYHITAFVGLLLVSGATQAQPYVVVIVQGEVTRSGAERPLMVGDVLRSDDLIQVAPRNSGALVVVVTPQGLAHLRPPKPAPSATRMAAAYVRDLLLPTLDQVQGNTRSYWSDSLFSTAHAMRRALEGKTWLMLNPQQMRLVFPLPSDRFVLRSTSDTGVREHELVYNGGFLHLDRESVGPESCQDESSSAAPWVWIVRIPADGPEDEVSGFFKLTCPDERAVLGIVTYALAEAGIDEKERTVHAAALLFELYGPTHIPSLRSWLSGH